MKKTFARIVIGKGGTVKSSAYSVCGNKAEAIKALGFGAKLMSESTKATIDNPGMSPTSSAPMDSIASGTAWTNTSPRYEDNEGNRGQGPEQGDHDFHERHMSERIVDEEVAGLDNPEFYVDNTPNDEVMAIATGPMTGPQRNPSPAETSHSDNAGTANEPMPDGGIQYPQTTPADVSLNPGQQNIQSSSPPSQPSVESQMRQAPVTPKDAVASDRADVQPLDSDSPAHHDTAGNINPDVKLDINHLKSVASTIQHSGKAGQVYLHPEKGYVHHVAHPDDLHPDNAHMYHSHEEIKNLYCSVGGVKGCKVAIMQYPSKGMGYKMIHKPGADPSVGESAEQANHRTLHQKRFLAIKGRLEHVIREKSGRIPDVARKILADAYVLFMKFTSLDPRGSGFSADLPNENTVNPTAEEHFTGIVGQNERNPGNAGYFYGGPPPEDVLNQESMNHFGTAAPPMNTITTNPPKSVAAEGGQLTNVLAQTVPGSTRRTDPGTMWNESVDGPNVPGSTAQRYDMLNDENVMTWLMEEQKSFDATDLEFEAMLAEELLSKV